MELTINNILKNSNHTTLLLNAHTLLMDLAIHKNKKIKISPNNLTRGESYYTLIDYKLYKTLEGLDTLHESLAIIIIVKNSEGAEFSFCLNNVTEITSQIFEGNESGIKYSVCTDNKTSDSIYEEKSPDVSNMDLIDLINEEKTYTYRFFLYD